MFILADDLGICDVTAHARRFTGMAIQEMYYDSPHRTRRGDRDGHPGPPGLRRAPPASRGPGACASSLRPRARRRCLPFGGTLRNRRQTRFAPKAWPDGGIGPFLRGPAVKGMDRPPGNSLAWAAGSACHCSCHAETVDRPCNCERCGLAIVTSPTPSDYGFVTDVPSDAQPPFPDVLLEYFEPSPSSEIMIHSARSLRCSANTSRN